MRNDLVERLRLNCKCYAETCTMCEAAEEIEQLRSKVDSHPSFARSDLAPLLARCTPYGDISVPDGWISFVLDLDKKISAVNPHYCISQVKEKFGGLRYYIEVPTYTSVNKVMYDIIDDLVHLAEQRSLRICQVCGKHGKLRNHNGWYSTLCDVHNELAHG